MDFYENTNFRYQKCSFGSEFQNSVDFKHDPKALRRLNQSFLIDSSHTESYVINAKKRRLAWLAFNLVLFCSTAFVVSLCTILAYG